MYGMRYEFLADVAEHAARVCCWFGLVVFSVFWLGTGAGYVGMLTTGAIGLPDGLRNLLLVVLGGFAFYAILSLFLVIVLLMFSLAWAPIFTILSLTANRFSRVASSMRWRVLIGATSAVLIGLVFAAWNPPDSSAGLGGLALGGGVVAILGAVYGLGTPALPASAGERCQWQVPDPESVNVFPATGTNSHS